MAEWLAGEPPPWLTEDTWQAPDLGQGQAALPELPPAAPPAAVDWQPGQPAPWLAESAWQAPDIWQPAEPPVTPDAISGGELPQPPPSPAPAPPLAQTGLGVMLPAGSYQAPAELQPGPRETPGLGAMARSVELANLPAEAYAATKATIEARRQDEEAAQTLDQAARDRAQAEQNYQIVQGGYDRARVALEDVSRQLTDLARSGVNNDHWWSTRSTPQRVAAYATAIIGGLLSPFHGGKNDGLSMILGEIDKDVETQKANLLMRRGVLSDKAGIVEQLYRQSGDLYRAGETARIAAMQNFELKLQAERQKYMPGGVADTKIADAILGVRQARAQAMAALEQETYKRSQDEIKNALEQAKFQEQVRARQQAAAEAAASRKAAAEERQAAAKERQQKMALEGLKEGFELDPLTGQWRAIPGTEGGQPIWDPVTGTFKEAKSGKPIEPQTRVEMARTENVNLQNQILRRGVQVHDSNGKLLGIANRGENGVKDVTSALNAYNTVRGNLSALQDKILEANRLYGGIGSGKWPQTLKTEIDSRREVLGAQLAKVLDPVGALSESAVQDAKGMIPDYNTLLTTKNPVDAYRGLTESIDRAMNNTLGAEIENWDPVNSPTRRYELADQVRKVEPTLSTEELQHAAITPPAGLLKEKGNETAAAAVVAKRAQAIDLMGKKGDLRDETRTAEVEQALQRDLAAGDLTEPDYRMLHEKLYRGWYTGMTNVDLPRFVPIAEYESMTPLAGGKAPPPPARSTPQAQQRMPGIAAGVSR